MDLNVEFCDETHVIEVALADTVEHMRRKVASAVGLPEDSFGMSFGDEVMGEGADMTQLSAGDTILLTKSMKFEAIAALHALGETDLRPKRLKKVKDPEVACLLLQAEVTTVIPDWFLERTSITRLDLSAVSTVTRIEDYFLYNCTSLTAVDLSSLNSLTHVEDYFLQECRSLTSVDLSSSNSLTHVGDGFLHECRSLTSLNLPSSNILTHVGDWFLRNCRSLTAVDLSSLKSLTHVGEYFLGECSSLTSVDLSSLRSVEHIDQSNCTFCSGLSGLQTIRLSGCSAVVSSAVEEAGLSHLVVDART